VDLVVGDQHVPLEGTLGRRGDVGVGTLMTRGKPHLHLYRHCLHSLDPLDGALDGVLFGMARRVASQGDDAVLHDHADIGGGDHWIEIQFGNDIASQHGIGFHELSSVVVWSELPSHAPTRGVNGLTVESTGRPRLALDQATETTIQVSFAAERWFWQPGTGPID
jgi:hypothetical protein